MGHETQKPETLSQKIELQPLDLSPGRALLTFRSVQAMFHQAVKEGFTQQDGVDVLRPDAFDVTDSGGRTLSMKVTRSVGATTGENVSGAYSIECRTDDVDTHTTRTLKVEHDYSAGSYEVSFGSTDELAASANVSAAEKVSIHLTKAESILASVLGVEEQDDEEEGAHLAAAEAVLRAVMYGGERAIAVEDEPVERDAVIIDFAAARDRRRK